jgi:hypothetical protein
MPAAALESRKVPKKAGLKTRKAPKKAAAAAFHSKDELRDALDQLLTAIDEDPEVGPTLRAAGVPHRLVFPDLGLVCNIAASEEPGHQIRWSFSDDVDWEPGLTLEMNSDVANRFLQGRENLVIAIARGQIRCRGHARAALSFVPVSPALIRCYRSIVKRQFPHLKLA